MLKNIDKELTPSFKAINNTISSFVSKIDLPKTFINATKLIDSFENSNILVKSCPSM